MQNNYMQWYSVQDGGKLKIQASLEFVLILSAVSLLALSIASIYATKMNQAKYLVGLNLSPPSQNLSYTENFFNISAYAPFQTKVGSEYSIDYVGVCPKGYINIYLYSPSILFSKNKINISIENIFAGYVYFIPEQSGIGNISLSYNALCNGAIYNGTLVLSTYAT